MREDGQNGSYTPSDRVATGTVRSGVSAATTHRDHRPAGRRPTPAKHRRGTAYRWQTRWTMPISPEPDRSRMLRDARLPGVEALHAHFLHHRYARHFHEAVTVAAVLHGAAAFDCGDRRYVAPAGSVFVIPPYEVHTGEPANGAGQGYYDYQVLYLSPTYLADLLAEVGRPGDRLRADPVRLATSEIVRQRSPAMAPLRAAHQAMTGPGDALLREHRLLAAALAVASDFGRVDRPGPPGREHRAVRRAREFLEADPARTTTLRELAAVSGLSMYRLAREFRGTVGLPPHAYQVQLRVLRAKALLRAGYPVAETAAACGFYDQAHLTAQFKRHVGVTPGAYAQAIARPL
jgi:AraC-like DNA-binding protein